MADSEDEVGTGPDFSQNGIGVNELPRIIKGSGTRLLSPSRPSGRIPQEP